MTVGSSLIGSCLRGPIPRCVVQELEQEAWLRTLSTAGVRQPKGFARRVARNLAVDYLRRQRTVPYTEGHQGVVQVRVESLDVRRLGVLLPQAPAAYRHVLTRLFLQEWTPEELVEELAGGPRKQVGDVAWARARDLLYKRRRRGLAWLRERM